MSNFDGDVTMEYLEDSMQLLAIQGPGAAEAVKNILLIGFQLEKMAFMTGADTTLDGVEGCRITRYVIVMVHCVDIDFCAEKKYRHVYINTCVCSIC